MAKAQQELKLAESAVVVQGVVERERVVGIKHHVVDDDVSTRGIVLSRTNVVGSSEGTSSSLKPSLFDKGKYH
jgi:hypothetical protein